MSLHLLSLAIPGMLMMQGTTLMVGSLTEAAWLLNLLKGFHVAQVDPVNIWAGDLLLVLAAALTVGLMGTGLVTAKLATGKTGAIVVEMAAI